MPTTPLYWRKVNTKKTKTFLFWSRKKTKLYKEPNCKLSKSSCTSNHPMSPTAQEAAHSAVALLHLATPPRHQAGDHTTIHTISSFFFKKKTISSYKYKFLELIHTN